MISIKILTFIKRMLACFLILALLPVFQSAAALAEDAQGSLYEALSSLSDVSRVELLSAEGDRENYMLHFTQPIDHAHPELGSFEQRVALCYLKDSEVMVYDINGYMLRDAFYENYYEGDFRTAMALVFDCTQVEIEYRFFFHSVPDGYRPGDLRLAPYMTSENACADFHHIITALGEVMPCRTIFTGASKGGYATNAMAYFYPEDIDAYVSVAAPLCNGREDPATYQSIYETIGNDAFGEEQAAKYRQLLLDFQIELLRNRSKLALQYYHYALSQNCEYSKYCTPDILFDLSVLDVAAAVWQMERNFAPIEQLMERSRMEKTEQEEAVYLNDLLAYLVMMESPMISRSNPIFPYYLQATTEMGENRLTFSYIRDELEKRGLSDYLSISEEEEEGLLLRVVFEPEELEQLTYASTMRDNLIAASKTGNKEMIFLYGSDDPWYSCRMPDSENPLVHTFVVKGGSHMADFLQLPQEEQEEFFSIIVRLLGYEGFLTE